MNLPDFLDEQTGRHAERAALQGRLRYRTQRWTYAELARRTATLAASLGSAGLRAGDRVLLRMDNTPDWVAAFFAILQRGAIAVPLNPRSPPEQVARVVASAQPRLLLRERRSPPLDLRDVPAWTLDMAGPRPELSAPLATGETPPAGVAQILYTSGTTGDPKGVMLTHDNLLFDMTALSARVPLGPGDRILNLAPLYHAYGQMTGMLCPLGAGCETRHVAPPTSRSILEALREFPATHLILVPDILKALLRSMERERTRAPAWSRPFVSGCLRRRLAPTLRTLVCGGAPLDAELEERCRALGFEVLQGYGLTETSPALTANAPDAHRPGSVGRPLPGVTLKLAPDGEVLARGPMTMAGYYRQPALTAAAFDGDWFRTGDIGRMDADGYLFLLGRRQYRIDTGSGENVFPEDIEAELAQAEGVTDSAVIGLERAGRTLIHAVLLCPAALAAAAVERANRRLAPHQRIVSWSVWPDPDFPRSATLKVRKEIVIRRLRESAPAAGAAAFPPATSPIRGLLAEISGIDAALIRDDLPILAGLGIDSLLRIELVARLEDRLGLSLEEARIGPDLTVAQLEALARRGPAPPRRMERPAEWALSPWARGLRPLATALLLRSWFPLCCRLRIEGREHLRTLDGPCLYLANHRSFLDSAAVALALPAPLRARLSIAAATEVLYRRYAWAAPLAELALNAFPLPTGLDENIESGFRAIGHRLDRGWSVLIYPEGRMNRGTEPLQPLKAGAGVLAIDMGAPIVPVAILGTERILPAGAVIPRRRGQVTVRFGPPMTDLAGLDPAAATARIRESLYRTLTPDTHAADGQGAENR